jgi:hypothetical protein
MTLLDAIGALASIVTAADRQQAALRARARLTQAAAQRAAASADRAAAALEEYDRERRRAEADDALGRQLADRAMADYERRVHGADAARRDTI